MKSSPYQAPRCISKIKLVAYHDVKPTRLQTIHLQWDQIDTAIHLYKSRSFLPIYMGKKDQSQQQYQ